MAFEKLIWSMDKLGLFFKLLPDQLLIEKAKSKKGTTCSCFLVNADGKRLHEPVIIWKSKKPRCFRSMKDCDLSRPFVVHYFSNKKAGMNC